jgi:hypothetical protein
MTRVAVGYAPYPALPGFPALFTRLKEVYHTVNDLVVAARSALAAGSTPDAERQLGQALELLSPFNLMAMWEAALQSVESSRTRCSSPNKTHGCNKTWRTL